MDVGECQIMHQTGMLQFRSAAIISLVLETTLEINVPRRNSERALAVYLIKHLLRGAGSAKQNSRMSLGCKNVTVVNRPSNIAEIITTPLSLECFEKKE